MQQHVTALQHLTDVDVECWTLYPLHEKDRETGAADENAFRRITERREIWRRRTEHVFLQRAVTLIAVAEVAAKAAHGEVAGAVHRLQLVNVGELARRDNRHAETIDGRQRLAQRRMPETDRRALNDFGEVPGGGPVSRKLFGRRGELARRDNRHAETIDGRQRLAQRRMPETD